MMSTLEMLVPAPWVPYVLFALFTVVTICSAIDASFPQPLAGSVWVVPRKIVSMIAMNFLNAKNAALPGMTPQLAAIAAEIQTVAAFVPTVITTLDPVKAPTMTVESNVPPPAPPATPSTPS